MNSWTDRLAHKFPSPERIRYIAEALAAPLALPVGRETTLHQAACEWRDIAIEMCEALMHYKRKDSLDPASAKELDNLVKLYKAMNPCWVSDARKAGL